MSVRVQEGSRDGDPAASSRGHWRLVAGTGPKIPTRIYRIVHVANLPLILGAGGTNSPRSSTHAPPTPYKAIHHLSVQAQRAAKSVPVGPQGVVHDYVPFYFNPRSPMLFALNSGAVEGHTGGQQTIIVLVSSAQAVAADGLGYVFTDGHSIMALSSFYDDLADLCKIRWDVVNTQYWPNFEDGRRLRQAEFMVRDFFPWKLVEEIGVYDATVKAQVASDLSNHPQLHQPPVKVMKSFYF